MGKLFRGRLL